MKPKNTFTVSHPSTAELDRLRAGLLDQTLDLKNELLSHLEKCASCQNKASRWRFVRAALSEDSLEMGISNELKIRRHRALNKQASEHYTPRHVLAVAAALMTVVIGLGIFLYTESPAPTLDVAVSTQDENDDLYADLDFYLWLTEKRNAETSRETNS